MLPVIGYGNAGDRLIASSSSSAITADAEPRRKRRLARPTPAQARQPEPTPAYSSPTLRPASGPRQSRRRHDPVSTRPTRPVTSAGRPTIASARTAQTTSRLSSFSRASRYGRTSPRTRSTLYAPHTSSSTLRRGEVAVLLGAGMLLGNY
jgi:hypothetical protein